MSQHRRPARLRAIRRPLHLGIAAAVAGTIAVTGTLVASAAPSHPSARASATRPTAAAAFAHPGSRQPDSGALDRAAAASTMRAALHASYQERLAQVSARTAARVRAERLAARRAVLRGAARHRASVRRAAIHAANARRAARRAMLARSRLTASRSSAPMSASAASVLAIAAAQQGDRYVHGGDGPDVFDCSGFTMYVFAKLGISLPHSAAAQRGVAASISANEVRPGDLVFVYNGGDGSVGHVAIYGGPGIWYEAANPRSAVGRRAAWSSNVSYGRVL